jgi:hypothetical protein
MVSASRLQTDEEHIGPSVDQRGWFASADSSRTGPRAVRPPSPHIEQASGFRSFLSTTRLATILNAACLLD